MGNSLGNSLGNSSNCRGTVMGTVRNSAKLSANIYEIARKFHYEFPSDYSDFPPNSWEQFVGEQFGEQFNCSQGTVKLFFSINIDADVFSSPDDVSLSKMVHFQGTIFNGNNFIILFQLISFKSYIKMTLIIKIFT